MSEQILGYNKRVISKTITKDGSNNLTLTNDAKQVAGELTGAVNIVLPVTDKELEVVIHFSTGVTPPSFSFPLTGVLYQNKALFSLVASASYKMYVSTMDGTTWMVGAVMYG